MSDMLHLIEYKCPVCNTKITRDILYPDYSKFKSMSDAHIVISTWCKRCESIHKYDIAIHPDKDSEAEKYNVKLEYFICNEEKIDINLELKESTALSN